jgi:hypothetical protein
MSRHYSTKVFFRQMPNALLARYFQARGLRSLAGTEDNDELVLAAIE